ncbi:SMC-Scp complex subunit ScpB [Amycolatopsis thermophila]|uniref:SMC-Scp complex subunit ScpB n=1 Tax=Amycolatopsis thermophila TaxID=206084 RepID=UPI0035216D68
MVPADQRDEDGPAEAAAAAEGGEPAAAESAAGEPGAASPAEEASTGDEPDEDGPADRAVDAGGGESAAVEPAAESPAEEVVPADQGAEDGPVDAAVAAAGGESAAAEPGAASPAEPEEDASTGDEPDDDGLVAVGDGLPDLTGHSALAAALEALLLVVDSPVTEEALASALGQSEHRVTQTLQVMSAELTERRSGIDLRRVGEGWRFYTRDTYAPFVEKLLLDGQRSKLTRAALETLAVIAYRQPVTRSRVAAVRGVNVDGVIRTLLARGLIEESGADPETGGTLYVTTELFLERLGLSSLTDLPPIAPLLPEVDSIDDI